MSSHTVYPVSSPDDLRRYTRYVLRDLEALEHLIESNLFETDVQRIGAEQEMFIIDSHLRPMPVSGTMLERLSDPHFTTELGRFNLEFNLEPIIFRDRALSDLHRQLNYYISRARTCAASLDGDILLIGTLPTMQKSDLGIENMTPRSRYYALNEVLRRLRTQDHEINIRGIDELKFRHDSVMVESCNTSFQIHLQVSPSEFARLYNAAQLITAPVLAVSTNSPFLLAKRLWHETRIAVFRQSVDTRSSEEVTQDRQPRVWFGSSWVNDSILELYQEDVMRNRVLFGVSEYEDPFPLIENGTAPPLSALQVHNSTVYRWNRPCYGITDGRPHLRIENRVLPSGPSPVDQVASAALWFGLMTYLRDTDVRDMISFDNVKTNFLTASQNGIVSTLHWLDGRNITVRELVLNELLPMAHEGLSSINIAAEDTERYLGIIRKRVSAERSGSVWQLESYTRLKDVPAKSGRLAAITQSALDQQKKDIPVHEWVFPSVRMTPRWEMSFAEVGQFMMTDVFSVNQDDVIDLAANMMEWKRIRHVPVEDDRKRYCGLITYRDLIRFMNQQLARDEEVTTTSAKEIMDSKAPTVTPTTSTLKAIRIMKKTSASCLPVIEDGRLAGIITEHDFAVIAMDLLQERLSDS